MLKELPSALADCDCAPSIWLDKPLPYGLFHLRG
jgi:hypothetical protein